MPTAPDGQIAIIVLAAGASVRMGRPKMLLPLDGEPIVCRVARRAVAAGAEQVVVVVPPTADPMRAALLPLGVTLVEPRDASGRMSASLHAGIGSLGAEVRAAIIVLGDMVQVTTAMLAEVVQRLRQPGELLVVSRYGGVTAPPLGLPRRLFAEVLASHGESIGKTIVAHHGHAACWIDWPGEALRDVDTPDDYQALTATP
jgi:CTP:molybdopterin cytidylyltransferase MocA